MSERQELPEVSPGHIKSVTFMTDMNETQELRNYFAGQALAALVIVSWKGLSNDPMVRHPEASLALAAWKLADAMLLASDSVDPCQTPPKP